MAGEIVTIAARRGQAAEMDPVAAFSSCRQDSLPIDRGAGQLTEAHFQIA